MANTAHEPTTAQAIVAERIRLLMWRTRTSQRKAAAVLGLTQGTISGKLAGRVAITVPELYGFASAIGCTVADLLVDVDQQIGPNPALLPRLDSNQQPSGYASMLVRPVADLASRRRQRLSNLQLDSRPALTTRDGGPRNRRS